MQLVPINAIVSSMLIFRSPRVRSGFGRSSGTLSRIRIGMSSHRTDATHGPPVPMEVGIRLEQTVHTDNDHVPFDEGDSYGCKASPV